jgi:hypothetical protein
VSNRPCNFCTYRRIMRDAMDNRRKVTLKTSTGELGGTDMLVDDEFVAWFMDLPDHCCC